MSPVIILLFCLWTFAIGVLFGAWALLAFMFWLNIRSEK